MKTIILSIMIAAALAVSATAQDCGVTNGMTLADVITVCGEPASVDHLYSHPDMMVAAWGEPARVEVRGVAERWYLKKGLLVVFDVNGRVAGIQNFNSVR
jgi:hypothetical protein